MCDPDADSGPSDAESEVRRLRKSRSDWVVCSILRATIGMVWGSQTGEIGTGQE